MTNIIRHAKATRVQIKLTFKPRSVQLILQDNGKGFNPEHHGIGFGLVSMRERAQCIAGELTLVSKRGKGSKVVVNVPG